MKLNLKTDYALRVLIFLQNEDVATIKKISDYYGIKKNHLSVVVNKLSELGYIDSTPGPGGGIALKKKTLDISLSIIVKNFENLDLVECFNDESNQCLLSPSCKLKTVLKKAQREFLGELDKYSVRDIATRFKV